MPIGKRNVLIGMSERTSRQADQPIGATLFAKTRSIASSSRPCRLRAAMHLDIFAADRDLRAALSRHRRQDRMLLLPAGRKGQRVDLRSDEPRPHRDGAKRARPQTDARGRDGRHGRMRERTQWDSGARTRLRLARRGLCPMTAIPANSRCKQGGDRGRPASLALNSGSAVAAADLRMTCPIIPRRGRLLKHGCVENARRHVGPDG